MRWKMTASPARWIMLMESRQPLNGRGNLIGSGRISPATEDGEVCRILSNARCLTEGVDVPSLDAVLFMNPRRSQVDVVQAVGRVMRKAAGKDYGYVILPVVIPEGEDIESALNKNEIYGVVWEVLRNRMMNG